MNGPAQTATQPPATLNFSPSDASRMVESTVLAEIQGYDGGYLVETDTATHKYEYYFGKEGEDTLQFLYRRKFDESESSYEEDEDRLSDTVREYLENLGFSVQR